MKVVGIITGVLMGILGVYAMFVPVRTFLGIGWALGLVLLMNGIEMVIVGAGQKKKQAGQIVMGILAAVAGCILLFSGVQRVLTDVMIAYIVGFAVLIYGIYLIIIGAQKVKEKKGQSILKIVCGVLAVIIGGMSIAHPVVTMISVGYLIAAALIMQGINLVVLMMSIEKK